MKHAPLCTLFLNIHFSNKETKRPKHAQIWKPHIKQVYFFILDLPQKVKAQMLTPLRYDTVSWGHFLCFSLFCYFYIFVFFLRFCQLGFDSLELSLSL